MKTTLAAPLRAWVLRAFPRSESGIDYDRPAGDQGLFGPDSATWRASMSLSVRPFACLASTVSERLNWRWCWLHCAGNRCSS